MRKRADGFTLVELLVGLAVGLMVLYLIYSLHVEGLRLFQSNTRKLTAIAATHHECERMRHIVFGARFAWVVPLAGLRGTTPGKPSGPPALTIADPLKGQSQTIGEMAEKYAGTSPLLVVGFHPARTAGKERGVAFSAAGSSGGGSGLPSWFAARPAPQVLPGYTRWVKGPVVECCVDPLDRKHYVGGRAGTATLVDGGYELDSSGSHVLKWFFSADEHQGLRNTKKPGHREKSTLVSATWMQVHDEEDRYASHCFELEHSYCVRGPQIHFGFAEAGGS